MSNVVARRRAIAALAASPLAVALSAGMAEQATAQARPAGVPGGSIPRGYEGVDPRTARRVALWHELRSTNPIFPGDPLFLSQIVAEIGHHGYLLEQILSLGTHTGTHVSAPAHFIEGGKYLSQLDERWTLMPLAVVDVRARVRSEGGDFTLGVADLQKWERRHGRIPAGGCVLLFTGFSSVFEAPAYFDPAPGFTGDAAAWLFDQRRIFALGSDTFGPDATSDTDFSATSTALAKGGITVENAGAGLARMRAFGDWISINGPRPRFSGFQVGITGFTV